MPINDGTVVILRTQLFTTNFDCKVAEIILVASVGDAIASARVSGRIRKNATTALQQSRRYGNAVGNRMSIMTPLVVPIDDTFHRDEQ